jgi:hypothetical protein
MHLAGPIKVNRATVPAPPHRDRVAGRDGVVTLALSSSPFLTSLDSTSKQIELFGRAECSC